jgi:hypothetical protein
MNNRAHLAMIMRQVDEIEASMPAGEERARKLLTVLRPVMRLRDRKLPGSKAFHFFIEIHCKSGWFQLGRGHVDDTSFDCREMSWCVPDDELCELSSGLWYELNMDEFIPAKYRARRRAG